MKNILINKKYMKNDIVFLDGAEPVTSTEMIAHGIDVTNLNLVKLINKYKEDFEEFGKISCHLKRREFSPKSQRKTKIYHLNEGQTILLFTYLKNTSIARTFKKLLTKQFLLMRKIIIRQQNAEWQQKRLEAKKGRRLETDILKDLVSYAVKNGSENSNRIYSNYSKMVIKALFNSNIKKNTRDYLDEEQLRLLETAEIIIAKQVRTLLADNKHYTEIYKAIKNKMLAFADIVGRSDVPRN